MLCLARFHHLSTQRLSRNLVRCVSSIVLRPYQEHCLEACTNALQAGSSRIGVSMPTGSGKTTVFVALLDRLQPPRENPGATKALIIVNSVELARQSAEQIPKQFRHWSVEIEQGAKYKATGLADVTVATYQTLLQPERLAKFNPKGLKAIIVDEAHHAAAPSYRRLLSRFHADIKHPDKDSERPSLSHNVPVIGFSATFGRHDGLALGSVFEQIVYHRDFLEMIKEQWLCDVRFTSVKANIPLEQVTVNARTGDFNPASLSAVINTDTINDLVVKTWIAKASDRKSTIVFCVNISHVERLTQLFRAYGVDARYVFAKTPATERKNLISDFKHGRFPILVNCSVLTEGADIPNTDCVVVARPTRSKNMFAQMIGRGMRLSPATGKVDCRIIDFVDSSNRVDGVISTPTLFGLDPDAEIEDESVESLEEQASQRVLTTPANVPTPKSVTYTDYDDPLSFVGQSSGAPHVARLSQNAWVGCGDDIYVLECMGKGFIRVVPHADPEDESIQFRASFTPASMDKTTATGLKVSPFFRSRPVLDAPTLGDAIRGCDTYAQRDIVRGNLWKGMLRTAQWRKLPASDAQKRFLSKRLFGKQLGGEAAFLDGPGSSSANRERLDTMTKGEAANLITRLRHGAKKRHSRDMQAKRKVQMKEAVKEAKEMRRRMREQVEVGPLRV